MPTGLMFSKFQVWTQKTLPSLPERTISTAFWKCGAERCWVPTAMILLVLLAARIIACPSATLWPIGFSTYTSLPASTASMVGRACQWSGVAMTTASRSLASSIAR